MHRGVVWREALGEVPLLIHPRGASNFANASLDRSRRKHHFKNKVDNAYPREVVPRRARIPRSFSEVGRAVWGRF